MVFNYQIAYIFLKLKFLSEWIIIRYIVWFRLKHDSNVFGRLTTIKNKLIVYILQI